MRTRRSKLIVALAIVLVIVLASPALAQNSRSVQFTHGVVTGTSAPRQVAADANAAEKERHAAYDANVRPLVELGVTALGILMLIGGPLLVYLLWYTKGRDKPVALPTDYLAEPPDPTLPAGLAGTLVDEKADMEDIIATLVDLAQRGVLAIAESKNGDFVYHKVGSTDNLREYEFTLVDTIFGTGGVREFSVLEKKFYTVIPLLKQQLHQAVVQQGFFDTRPDLVRNRYAVLGIVLLVLSAVVSCGATMRLFSGVPTMALLPALGLGATAMAFIVVARHMPRKTDKGVAASVRWLAFKRYLQEIEKYTDLADNKPIFETYLAYAIAFGIDRSWIDKFTGVDAPIPPWWIPYPSYEPVFVAGDFDIPGGGDAGGLTGEMPGDSLSDMSRLLGSGLSSMSSNLGTMLSSASAILTSRPDSPPDILHFVDVLMGSSFGDGGGGGGGGWSGGGGVGGGGGGGGGGDFG